MIRNGNKRKLLFILAVALTAAVCAAVLCACSEPVTKDEILDEIKGNGNTVNVRLDCLNGEVINYWLKPGSVVPQPGVTANVSLPLRENYVFKGFYEGSMGENNTVEYGGQWDFTTKVTEETVLYAKWEPQFKIRIVFVMDGVAQTGQSAEMNVYNNVSSLTSVIEPSWAGNTFVNIYTTEDCGGEPLKVSSSQPYIHGCTEAEPVKLLYAKFIPGSWKLVYTASDLTTIYAGNNIYLMDDIDFSSRNDGETGLTSGFSVNSATFVGSIEGNGHTISNLNYLRVGDRGTGKNYIGLFTRVKDVTIRNVTFKDCSVTGQVSRSESVYYYGFLAGEAAGENVFENIVFDNCTLNPLTFGFLPSTATPEQIAAETAKVQQSFFIAEGTDYLPEII